MGVNKVVFGEDTLLDLTGDTVNEDSVLEGILFHGPDGSSLIGKLTMPTDIDFEIVIGIVVSRGQYNVVESGGGTKVTGQVTVRRVGGVFTTIIDKNANGRASGVTTQTCNARITSVSIISFTIL